MKPCNFIANKEAAKVDQYQYVVTLFIEKIAKIDVLSNRAYAIDLARSSGA